MSKKEKVVTEDDNPFICVDCDVDTFDIDEADNYQLRKHVIDTIRWSPCIQLCMGCVERRLGRELTFKDFTRSVQNLYVWPMERSRRLQKRMGFAV
jgi:hypothetical protein